MRGESGFRRLTRELVCIPIGMHRLTLFPGEGEAPLVGVVGESDR
jgi:hypothetical protein